MTVAGFGFLLMIIISVVLLWPLWLGVAMLRELLRRRTFRIGVSRLRFRIVISQYQVVAMSSSAVLVYAGSLVEAATYNADCTYMAPQHPGFSGIDVLIGLLLLLPCLLLVRKPNWRIYLAGTSASLVMMSMYYFIYAFGPIGCVNSGGMTDAYDAPIFCEFFVFSVVLLVDYIILSIYAMNRAAVIVRHKYRVQPSSGA